MKCSTPPASHLTSPAPTMTLQATYPRGHCTLCNDTHYSEMEAALHKVARPVTDPAEVLRLASDASRIMRADPEGKTPVMRKTLLDPFAWLALDMMDLDAPAWQHLIGHVQDQLTTDVMVAFSEMADLRRRKVSGTERPVIVMYRHGDEHVRMAMAKCRDPHTEYTVGDHTTKARVDGHLQRELDMVKAHGMSPYHPTFIMLNGRVMYRDRCQWGNSELELTAHQKSNRFYICVHGQDSRHGYNSGMYKDSQARREGDAPPRACKRRRR